MVAGISFFVLGSLQVISFVKFRQRQKIEQPKRDENGKLIKQDPADLDLDEVDSESFLNKHSFKFLVPPRSSLVELIVVLFLIPLYGYFATYLCHPVTSASWEMQVNGIQLYEQQVNYQVLAYIVVTLSSYSLINLPIPENTPYGTDDSFSSVSHHYQRIYYQVIIGFFLLAHEMNCTSIKEFHGHKLEPWLI